ncbi:MAG: hypothetical protein ACRCV0_00515 [Brevinema sp.]
MSLLDFSKAYKTPKEMNKILLEGYMNTPITQSMDKGYYTITDDDRKTLMFFNDSFLGSTLMQRIYKHIGSSNASITREARKACGYSDAVLHSDEISKKRVFVVTQKALDGVKWEYSKYSKPKENVSGNSQNRAKIVALFANFLGANIKKLVCTSTTRTIKEQADIIAGVILEYPNSLKPYKRVRSLIKEDILPNFLNNEISKDEFYNKVYEKAIGDISSHTHLYYHVESIGDTFDIGPEESKIDGGSKTFMNNSMDQIRKTGFIDRDQSFLLKEFDGENAFHFVIK